MIKRTTGRLLLTLLVITGLAGTLDTGSLSQKERKQAINLIKSSRKEVLNSIEGLSPRQLKYKPSPNEASISELIMAMVLKEKNCSEQIRAIMDQPGNSENRLKIGSNVWCNCRISVASHCNNVTNGANFCGSINCIVNMSRLE